MKLSYTYRRVWKQRKKVCILSQSLTKRLICLLLSVCLVIGAVAVSGYADTYSSLKRDERSSGVEKMQKRLIELGYLDSGATGYYGSMTADAVEDFQKAVGLSPYNGDKASSEMLALLYAADAPAKGGSTVDSTKTDEDSSSTLRWGTTSDQVKKMQEHLKKLGYFSSSTTGYYGDKTAEAVAKFLKDVGVSSDGKKITASQLEQLYAATSGSTVAPTSAPTVTPTPTNNATMPDMEQVVRYALYYGDSNDAVKLMQERLIALGYLNTVATGGYWSATTKAVKSFLTTAGMSGDGKTASVEMLNLLFSSDAPIKGGVPTVAPTQNGGQNSSGSLSLVKLTYGMSGSDAVKLMQDRLRELGYFTVESTGGYYSATKKAVKAFLSAVGMSGDGKTAAVAMLERLYAADAPMLGGGTLQPSATVTPTPTLAPTVTPTPTSTPVVNYVELKYGMSGSSNVKNMQNRLRELGYFNDYSTGGYYSATKKAVKAFLSAVGMSGDGKTATVAMLRELYDSAAPVYGTTKAPSASTTPDPSVGDDDAPDASAYVALSYGMKAPNQNVYSLQARLYELGYLSVAPTGGYWSLTVKAVKAFLSAVGMSGNGEVATPEMQAKLFSSSAPAYGATSDGTSSDGEEEPSLSYNGGPLYYETQGSAEVKAMQRRLKELGFFTGTPTGNYYGQTADAVKQFQEYCNLEVNRKVASTEMLAYLFYEGDLDQLIADKSKQDEPVTPEEPGNSEFDESKYAGARTDVLLSNGMADEQVAYLIMRLNELGYLSEAQTSYNQAVIDAVKWFQNTNMLDSDGIAGPATLRILYSNKAISANGSLAGSDSKPGQVDGDDITVDIDRVENVDFFSDEGEKYYNRKTGLFRDGATATVTDVKTGVTFRVKRCGGYNHADVEPLTAADTWKIYSLYGEEWSWSRRSIWVTLSDGTTLAASMNGMPHGGSSIEENNFDGHFCIHFLNSRTHGTDNVDPDHQNAVDEAASGKS